MLFRGLHNQCLFSKLNLRLLGVLSSNFQPACPYMQPWKFGKSSWLHLANAMLGHAHGLTYTLRSTQKVLQVCWEYGRLFLTLFCNPDQSELAIFLSFFRLSLLLSLFLSFLEISWAFLEIFDLSVLKTIINFKAFRVRTLLVILI